MGIYVPFIDVSFTLLQLDGPEELTAKTEKEKVTKKQEFIFVCVYLFTHSVTPLC